MTALLTMNENGMWIMIILIALIIICIPIFVSICKQDKEILKKEK
jgi:hypothetical protein